MYGVDYRYTTAYGLFSGQLLNKNSVYGIDFRWRMSTFISP